MNTLNELSTITNSGTLTVSGTTTTNATSVTVNGSLANRYNDATFALGSFTVATGINTFTAIAQDALGRNDTNSISVNLPATVSCAYDLNGNLTSDGTRGFDYDDENQLIRVTVTNSWKTEFAYDGKLRRRQRIECTWNGTTWLTNTVTRYLYDGNLVIQERDNNGLPSVTYTRGNDLSGSLQGAGGIGGLVARTDAGLLTTGASAAHAYYHADGNGNITALINTNQALVAKYLYDPFGNILSQSGSLADANLYRYSSKELHKNSGLVYYLYRYYEPSFQRWLTRDPIVEDGGINLYEFVRNYPVGHIDLLGLDGELTLAADPTLLMDAEELQAYQAALAKKAAIAAAAAACIAAAEAAKNKKCDKEWAEAREWCRNELAKPPEQRSRYTGGYSDIENCARARVSQECGGNPVTPKPKPSRRPPFYGK